MLGRRYLDKDMYLNENTLSINVSSLKRGAYVYFIKNEDGWPVMTNKFMKE